jgi:hypothetical protein
MGRRQIDEAIERAQFAVRDLTNSRVSSDAVHRAEELHAQQLRDIGWDSYDGDEAVMGR